MQKEGVIDIEDSSMYLDEGQMMLMNLQKSKSDESMLGIGKYFINHEEKRPLIISGENKKEQSEGFQVFKKKIKKPKKHNFGDYKKNICGYITKKIIREYISHTYSKFVNQLCLKHQCSYQQSKLYYLSQIETVTGPSHIPHLITPNNLQEVNIKLAFKQFFQWFLKERYLRYLLIDGKMKQKLAYIKYKNDQLLLMVQQHQYPKLQQSSETLQ